MLEAREATVKLGAATVLREVSLALRPGEVLALAGPNGAGKSTLLACFSGAQALESGAVLLDGVSVESMTPPALAAARSVLEQNPIAAAEFSLRELVGLSIPRAVSPSEASRIVQQAIDALALGALAERRIGALSGGERHRAHMARALAQLAVGRLRGGGRWLLLDEPTASLDLAHQAAVSRCARAAASQGVGVLAVLHDLTLAARMADRVALLDRGRLKAVGAPRRTLTPENLAAVYGLPVIVSEPEPGALTFTPNYGHIEKGEGHVHRDEPLQSRARL